MHILAVGSVFAGGFFLALTLQWALLEAILRRMARAQQAPTSAHPAGAS